MFIMLTWIAENIATIIISAIILTAVALIIAKMVRDKKNENICNSCGYGCEGCPAYSGVIKNSLDIYHQRQAICGKDANSGSALCEAIRTSQIKATDTLKSSDAVSKKISIA
jgi:hypothetical protein